MINIEELEQQKQELDHKIQDAKLEDKKRNCNITVGDIIKSFQDIPSDTPVFLAKECELANFFSLYDILRNWGYSPSKGILIIDKYDEDIFLTCWNTEIPKDINSIG